MSAATASRPADPPLGGAHGAWSYRLLRYHVPLALVSAVATILWLSLPLFRSTGHQAAPRGAVQSAHAAHETQAAHGRSSRPAQSAGHGGPAMSAGHGPPAAGATSAASAMPSMDHTSGSALTGSPIQDRAFMARLTTATGYVALVLLATTLLLGPANLLLRRRNPISSYLRRDVGTWTAIVSVVHVVAGFQVHGPPVALVQRLLRYFFAPDGSVLTDSFGLGNWTGLAATVIVVGLLALSSDLALRKLKARTWKWLQRLNYALFVLVVLHTLYYGALVRAMSPATLLLGFSVAAVLAGQSAGIWLRQRSIRGGRVRTPPRARAGIQHGSGITV